MIERKCVAGDAAGEAEQRPFESDGSLQITAAEIQYLLQEELSSAGLHPDACHVTVTDGLFVEIRLHDASKLWLAEEIMQEQVCAGEECGISLTYIVRA